MFCKFHKYTDSMTILLVPCACQHDRPTVHFETINLRCLRVSFWDHNSFWCRIDRWRVNWLLYMSNIFTNVTCDFVALFIKAKLYESNFTDLILIVETNNYMMTSSNGNIFRVTGHLCGEFTGPRWILHTQRPVTCSCDIYFDLRPNKQLSKQSLCWWFETLSPPLWRHRNENPPDQ